MKKRIKRWGERLFFILAIFLCGIIVAMASGYRPKPGGYQVLRVLTASMSPILEENCLILIREVAQEDIAVGDIITFESEDPALHGYYNTHRVSRIVTDETTGEEYYITKGDMNQQEDYYPVHYDEVAGRLVTVIPYSQILGNLVMKLVDQRIYFVVVMLPLLYCLISYIWDVYRAIVWEKDEDNEDEKDKSEDDS
jgi:signal peptidase